jgi:2-polyprenyl-3-methyl-5-hydroxy-6-metoxy-1,4-benzoquinol methylase
MTTFDEPLTKCNICGSENIYHYHTAGEKVNIYRCKNCSIQFMNPQYSDQYLKEYYSDYIIDEPEWEEPLVYCHNYYLSIVEKYVQKGRLLDVGAGKGYLLEAAIGRGWETEGYDIDLELTKKLNKKYNVNIYCGDFESAISGNEAYSAVTLHQVIEHIKNPLPYLKKIHQILKPAGILLIVLPNIQSRSAIFKLALEKLGIRKKNIGAYYDTSHHMFYYTPSSLCKMVESCGFKVEYMKSGHAARADQSKLKRFMMRNVGDRILWKSTFLAICRKI